MKKLLATTAFVAAVGAPALAHASYICTTSYIPGSSSRGSEGHTYAFMTSQPGCSGTWEGVSYFCSTGATSPSCASSSYYHYNREGLLGLFDAFREAMADAQFAWVVTTTCNGGSWGCPGYMQFDAT